MTFIPLFMCDTFVSLLSLVIALDFRGILFPDIFAYLIVCFRSVTPWYLGQLLVSSKFSCHSLHGRLTAQLLAVFFLKSSTVVKDFITAFSYTPLSSVTSFSVVLWIQRQSILPWAFWGYYFLSMLMAYISRSKHKLLVGGSAISISGHITYLWNALTR